jgi:diguanylate cyclase (GGDEF)-like protein/PAS domain S-box-containing protein
MLQIELASLVDALPGPALILDSDDAVLAANPAALELLAAGASDLNGTRLSDIAPEGTEGALLNRLDGSPFQAEATLSRLDPDHRLLTIRDVTEERRTASQLADAERIARVAIWEWHVPSNTVIWSPEAFNIFGRDPAVTTPSYEVWLDTIHPEDREWVNDFVQNAFQKRIDYDFQHRVRHPNGEVRHIHCRGQVILDEQGEPLRLVGASQDITERVSQAAEIDRIAGQREAILDAAGEGVCGLDRNGRVSFVNPSACALLGDDAANLIGIELAGCLAGDDGPRLREAIAAGRIERNNDATLVRPDGVELPIAFHCAPLREGEDETVGAVVTMADVSERKSYEAQLTYLAERDALTGLLNRRRFEEVVQSQTAYAAQYGGSLAVLVLDIDHFKDLNDTAGHSAGDEVLRTIGRLLEHTLEEVDAIARLGGDEYAVLLPAADEKAALEVSNRLREAVAAQVMLVDGRSLQVTASIGVAIGPGPEGTAEELLADADVAMYQGKENDRNSVTVYHPGLGVRERMQQRITWSKRLRTAVDSDGFILFAQPILEFGKSAFSRFEVLLRLPHDDGTVASPIEFLPIAERHGLIRDIDRWVVARAIAIAAAERSHGRATILEVNLSGLSMGDPELPKLVAKALAETGADPAQLVFEVTETAAIDNLHEARELALAVVDLGCSFAIDDFGAGFGSFAYLKHLPADYVKIDGDFIRRLPSNPTDQLVVNAIVELAHGMDKLVVAEMVEDRQTAEMLAEMSVDFAQGYHFGHPMPADEVLGVAALQSGP